MPMRIFRLSCASAVGEREGVGELEEIKGWVSGDQKVSVRDPLHCTNQVVRWLSGQLGRFLFSMAVCQLSLPLMLPPDLTLTRTLTLCLTMQ